MKTYRRHSHEQQRRSAERAGHMRRNWALHGEAQAAIPPLSLGTLQALMGLAGYRAQGR